MKLDRNINGSGRGKYALLKLRCLAELAARSDQMPTTVAEVNAAIDLLARVGILDWGNTVDTEFFLIRLKDKYADDALFRYALSAHHDGEADYALEIEEMAERAGANHPNCKKPD
jgi:hypothetical protein